MAKSKKAKIKKEVKKDVKAAIHKAVKAKPTKKISLRKRAKAGALSVKGRGGYWADLGRSVGGGIGGLADGVIGLGKAITGVGDYSIKSNSLMETAGPPRIRNTKHQSIVHHEEFLGDIKGSIDFRIQQFPINPGVTTTFPWLAGQASGYEQWKPRGIIFSFRSSCGDAISSTDNAEGMVIMATEYNSNLPPFNSKQEMEEHEYVTSFKPSGNGLHGVECARSLTPLSQLYIRNGTSNGSNSQNYNPLSYDLGQFYVATQGMQVDDVTIGELWISYEIELLKPTLSPVISTNIYQHWTHDPSLGDPPDQTHWYQNLRNVNTGETTANGAVAMTGIPPGRYIFCYIASASTITMGALADWDSSLTNGTSTPWSGYSYVINADQTIVLRTGVGTNFTVTMCGVTFTGVGATTYAPTTLTGVVGVYDLHIFPIGAGLQAKSRRAVDWDPFARLNRRIDDIMQRLGVEDMRDRFGRGDVSYPRAFSMDEKEDTPNNSPVMVRSPEIPDLSRSQVDFATSLLSRLSARGLTSKTGSVQAA